VAPGEKLSVAGNVMIGDSTWSAGTTTGDLAIQGNVGIGTTNPSTKLDFGTSVPNVGQIISIYNTGNVKSGIGMDSVNAGMRIYSPISQQIQLGSISTADGVTFAPAVTVDLNNGNVGIGTTGPGELLSLGTAGTTAGVLSFAGVTSGKIIIQTAADAGTWTMTLPTAVGGAGQQLTDVAGDGVTSWAAAGSSRELKDIVETVINPNEALTQILSTPIYKFNYKKGKGTGDTQTEYVGVMADEAPWAMHYNRTIINPVNTLGYMVLGIQATNKKITDLTTIVTNNLATQITVNDTLLASIQELNLKINDISGIQIGTPVTSLGQYASMFFSDVLYSVQQSTAYMKALVVDTLTIGSPSKPTGITVYDKNGQAGCLEVEDVNTGAVNIKPGSCDSQASSSTSTSTNSGGSSQSSGDTIAPVITLNGEATMNLAIGDSYNEESATAVDLPASLEGDVDGDVAVIISGEVDTSIDGTYIITYSATDTAGNTATTERIVIVGTGTAPVVEEVAPDSISSPQVAEEPSAEEIPADPAPALDPAPAEETPADQPPSEPAV